MEVGPLNYDKVILPEGTSISDFNHYVLFARGCLGSCLFCTSRAIYKHWITSIGLESFRSELEYVAEAVSKRKRGEKTIGILDDDLLLTVLLDAEGNITNDEKQAVDSKTVFDIIAPVLEDVNRMYPEISFIAQARVGHLRYFNESMENDRVNDPTLIFRHLNTLNQMKECGIDMVLLGIESGSQKILDASVKQTRVEWVKPACMRLHEAGIEVGAFWIVGLPGATFEEEEKSLEILDSGQMKVYEKRILFLHEDSQYEIIYSATEDDYQKYKDVAEEIIQSFKFRL